MIFPTVHLNGTSREDLLEQLSEANYALHHAILKLQNAGPNGRDYYPQGIDVISKAVQEHSNRLTKLQEVQNELNQLMERICDQ